MNKYKVKYAGKVACILTDTGNGFKVKFPPYSSTEQAIYMSLSYSQAIDLFRVFKKCDKLGSN